MTDVRLLVISEPCREELNRTVYRRLAVHDRINLHLVIPVRPADRRECAPVDGEPFPATILELRGAHPRLERAPGLKQLIRDERPTHVLVDAEPASMLVRDVASVTSRNQTRIWALSNENRLRNFVAEGADAFVHGRFTIAIGGFIASWLMRSARQALDRVFTISREGAAVMSQMGFAGRVTQVPLGFDPQLFCPQTREQIAVTRSRLGLNAPTVAYFGRMVPGKGVHLLIDALAALQDLRWQLLMDEFSVYPSPYHDRIRAQIDRLGLGNRVVHFDAAHRQIADYMNAADIVVLPSITMPTFKEQYGRVIPEAMACGKIVVGSSSGAIPELIGDAGFVFPEGDVAALTQLLRSLITSPDNSLEPMRNRAHERALRELSVVRQADILLGQLLANGSNAA